MFCKLKALQWSYTITRYQYTWFAWDKKLFQWICVTMDTAFMSFSNLRCRHNQRLTICVVAQWVACLNRNRWLPMNREFESHQKAPIVSLSEHFYHHCLVLFASRNGFERNLLKKHCLFTHVLSFSHTYLIKCVQESAIDDWLSLNR